MKPKSYLPLDEFLKNVVVSNAEFLGFFLNQFLMLEAEVHKAWLCSHLYCG